MTEKLHPRVYVASLSDYNAGRLHGVWIDATDDPDECWGRVNAMLAASPEPIAEEYAIHDHEGFGPVHLDEYTPLDTAWRIATGIAEHGMPYAAWVALRGTTDLDELEAFDDHYEGSYPDLESWAEELLSDLGIDPDPTTWPGVSDFIAPFVDIDIAALAQAMASDIESTEVDGEVHIFRP